MANIYYSVGQNTSDHKTGSPTLTISSGVATFSVAQTATNMGVGDEVTYGTTSKKCYLVAKTSTTVWTVVTNHGATPSDEGSAQTVSSIAHCFSSLSLAEAGTQNSAHLGTQNLSGNSYNVFLPCYYDSGYDYTKVLFDSSWTTSASYHFTVYSPHDTDTECNLRQQHDKKWDTGKYRLSVNESSAPCIKTYCDYLCIKDLQLEVRGTWNAITDASSTDFLTVKNCIIKGTNSGSRYGIYTYNDTSTSETKIFNNVIYGPWAYGIVTSADAKKYVYNNTVEGTDSEGILDIGSTANKVCWKNNVVINCGGGIKENTSGRNFSSEYNAVNSGQTNYGTNQITLSSTTLSNYFEDGANGDFRIKTTATYASELLDAAADLHSDSIIPFDYDFGYITRPDGTWDVGADQETAGNVEINTTTGTASTTTKTHTVALGQIITHTTGTASTTNGTHTVIMEQVVNHTTGTATAVTKTHIVALGQIINHTTGSASTTNGTHTVEIKLEFNATTGSASTTNGTHTVEIEQVFNATTGSASTTNGTHTVVMEQIINHTTGTASTTKGTHVVELGLVFNATTGTASTTNGTHEVKIGTRIRKFELARIGYDPGADSENTSVFLEFYSKAYSGSGHKKYVVNCGRDYGTGSYSLISALGDKDKVRIELGTPVTTIGTEKYLPVYAYIAYDSKWDVRISHGLYVDASSDTPPKGWIRVYDTYTPSEDVITLSVEAVEVPDDIWLADNIKLLLGTGKDVELYYDGTDLQLKTNIVSPSDLLVNCGTEKTVELVQPVYEDLQVQMGNVMERGWGGNDYVEIKPIGNDLIALVFEKSTLQGFKIKFNAQFFHAYAEGVDAQFHFHYYKDGTASGDVVFEISWQWANVDTTFGSVSVTEKKTFTLSTTDTYHGVLKFANDLSATGKKISSIIGCTVVRKASDAADTFSGNCYIIGVDYHIPINTNGSRQKWVK